jgi:hypothetical protein
MRRASPFHGWQAAAMAILLSVALGAPARAADTFADWAAVFVAGDWHAHSGKASEAFDNARVDVGKEFIAAGFAAQNVRQFSVRPKRYADHPKESRPDVVGRSLDDLARTAQGGCLFYMTSHGAPDGVVFGRKLLAPSGLARMVDKACGTRPTVVIISACFSGVFIPALAGADRMVLTAARPDRTSFGCGESDRYPYFDTCVVQALPASHDFIDLADKVRACVATEEKATGAEPPSEPQLSVGAAIRPVLAGLAFTRP